ncbi:MAG: gliding motility-associated ABC transporter substrate-binding protein GldG [Bacteroidota bacterium]
MKKKDVRRNNLIELFLLLAIIVLISYVGNYLFFRIDLTSDKRYTLSETTIELLENLEDIVFFKVYIEGDLPAGFKRLQNSTKEILDEFRVYGGSNIEYEFIDPSENTDERTRNDVFRQLYEKGLDPANIQAKEKDGSTSQKLVFPGTILSYRGQEMPVNLLGQNTGYSPDAGLNNAVQTLEYELTNGIRKLIRQKKPRIAFIEGHGELPGYETADISLVLSDFYTIKRVRIDGRLKSLDGFDAIVIAKPDSAFTERDKFIIDQFIMNGGSSFWLIDPIKINMDSLAYSDATLATIKELNLSDQLFKYGVRINPKLVQDNQCAVIPINTSTKGTQAKFSPARWIYFPLLTPLGDQPITKNIGLIKTEFLSNLDTVGHNYEVRKKYLLYTSDYSRLVNAPALISLRIINDVPDEKYFDNPFQPVAVLMEGRFESVFNHRIPTTILESKEIGFKDSSKYAKMIVVADGDIIKNPFKIVGGEIYPLPLGSDKWFQEIYYSGNKDFIMNCINYLCGDPQILAVRAKDFKLRLLDKKKTTEQRFLWQIMNTIIPVLFTILVGIAVHFFRKKKYAKNF